jgi:hypothetical protein
MTEKIISQGESLHLRTGRSVVRGKHRRYPGPGGLSNDALLLQGG